MARKPTYEELERRVLELEGREHYRDNFEIVAFPQLEKHDAVILIIDPDSGSIVDANIAAENYYGYSIKTLKQMKIQEINVLPPDEVAEKMQQAANEKLNYFEFPHRLSSGEIRTVEVHSSPILLNGKKLLLSIIHDITDRKKSEEALRKSEKDLRKSQQIAHVGSWRLDLATNQVEWTEELYRMYGFDPALPPPPYTEHMKLFTTESWKRLSTSLARTAETGIPYELELETVKDDGSNGWMWVRGEAVNNAEGQIIGVWGAGPGHHRTQTSGSCT